MGINFDKTSKFPPFCSFHQVNPAKIRIQDLFWNSRLVVNLQTALPHQYKQLEEVGTIDNFRLVAGLKQGFRKGYYYCDSDAHKWADAVSLALLSGKNDQIENILNEYVDLLEKAQQEDGYLFTYNQFHFPSIRWHNILFEHELYTLGHLIEAGISHYTVTGDLKLLQIVLKSADLLLREFSKVKPIHTPGHQELELALMKLYRLTHESKYLDFAKDLLENRGKIFWFPIRMSLQRRDTRLRKKAIDAQKISYEKNRQHSSLDAQARKKTNSEIWIHKTTPMLYLRAVYQHLSGKYYQQHRSLRHMTVPVGHAVRWGYMMTAATMLFQETGDRKLLSTLEKSWERMVQKRMYITGGIGALHTIEGFGRDFELSNDQAYNESCSGIASTLWAWEMAIATGKAKYSDLIEWQIYNAISVGTSLDGKSYFYYNPLESTGFLERKPWYSCACCPPNLSRIFAKLHHFIYGKSLNTLWIHQFVGNTSEIDLPQENSDHANQIKIEMKSKLPWEGFCEIKLSPERSENFSMKIRIPGWSTGFKIMINGEIIKEESPHTFSNNLFPPSGIMVSNSKYIAINRTWNSGDTIEIHLQMDILIHDGHPKIKANRGKKALTRGPLVYCLESVDNPYTTIPNARFDITQPIVNKIEETVLGGIITLNGKTAENMFLKFIPYFLWANRGLSSMQVWMIS